MKFFGMIGYTITEEQVIDGKTTGVWEPKIIEKPYRGDIQKLSVSRQSSDRINDDFRISNRISILSEPFICNNFQNIAYVKWMGSKWKVSTASIEYPRIILELGGVYND